MVQGEERAQHAACNVLLSVRAGVHHERTCRRGCMANLRKGCSKDSLPLSVSKKMEKTKKVETFLPRPLPGEGPYDVRQHQRRRKTKKEKAKAKKAATRKATAALTATQYKQPTMLRRCRAAMTRATLKVATRRSATASTPDSTGKANFPHTMPTRVHLYVVQATSPRSAGRSLTASLRRRTAASTTRSSSTDWAR